MLKNFFKKIITTILNWEARLILKKYKPKIIGVTGSVGKTSTKDAIYTVLSKNFHVRRSEKSYNSEFGLPLTVIGCRTAWNSLWGWLKNILLGLWVLYSDENYPKWLILEVGADRPGDIKKVAKWLSCDIVVVTRLPDVPVHIEFFKSKEEVIEEKLSLPRSVKQNGLVVSNIDDEIIRANVGTFRGRQLSYAIDKEADVRGTDIHISYRKEEGREVPVGLSFKIDYQGNNLPIKIDGLVGDHIVYPLLAAFAVGAACEMNLIDIIEALKTFETPPGRLHLIEGIKNTYILDDTYNASPVALEAGLWALKQIKTNGRKIAVLGDMLELGSFTLEAHKKAGARVAKVCDLLYTVGLRSKFYEEGAHENKMLKKHMRHFDNAWKAGQALQNVIEPGDIIYIKGSQSMRMEKAVEEIMLHPEKKEKLLVRQEREWLNR